MGGGVGEYDGEGVEWGLREEGWEEGCCGTEKIAYI